MLLSPHLYTDWRQWLIATILIYLSVILCDAALTHLLVVHDVLFICLPVSVYSHTQAQRVSHETSIHIKPIVYSVKCFDAVNLVSIFFVRQIIIMKKGCSFFVRWHRIYKVPKFKSQFLQYKCNRMPNQWILQFLYC